MNDVDVISYRARAGGDGMVIIQTATSIRDLREGDLWQRRLEPWLRLGSPKACAFADFGPQAAFIRWQADSASQLEWQRAIVLVGQSARLTGTAALELADPGQSGVVAGRGGVPSADGTPGPRRDAVEAWARSEDAITALIPLLAHALQGARRVTLPWKEQGLAEAVMWGFLSILRMIGDSRSVSFLTHTSGAGRDADTSGLMVSFRPDVDRPLPPDEGFAALAADLARRFAADPPGLRRMLAQHRVPETADDSSRISRLLSLPLRDHFGVASGGGTPTMTSSVEESATPAGSTGSATPIVMCPICLGDIRDWNALDYWRWDATLSDGEGAWAKVDIPADLTPTQRARYTYGAYVRCSASADEHYLPARYGRFGEPVLLGFVGLTQSGKTHLLASMVGAISGLSDYGIEVTELDPATHRDFLEKFVKPLIAGHKVLPGTPDDATTALADAFIVRQGDGPERVVALFDVSGGNLARVDNTTEFLWIADGLFFIVDPDHIGASKVGDDTFSSVLGIMAARHKAEKACAAIVLNKADKARFEEPVTRWLRAGDGTLDPTEFLRESADVYAYLEQHQAAALTKPYLACSKATLHVASPTGGAQEGEEKAGKYPRGVTPLRVLRPLVAMLAMTGVLTGPDAEKIGV